MRWVTRERPKTDRIACPWLIKRFIDPDAEILYVPADQVLAVAEEPETHSFDAEGAEVQRVVDERAPLEQARTANNPTFSR